MTLWQDVDRMDAMSRSLCHIATTEDAGNRLDALCAARGLYASRSAAARAIEEGRVFVNGATVSKKHAVAAGDTIVYEVDEEPESVVVYGEPIDLDVRFEDEDMLVLSKQIGLVCHPSVDHAHGTLVNALIWHCGEENLCNVQGEEADRLGIVHRLDRDTSGLMLAAKTDEAGCELMAQIQDRAVDRHYIALVHGIMAHDTGMIDAPIARSADERCRMAVRDTPSAREAITTFRVLSSALKLAPRTTATASSSVNCSPGAPTRSACTCSTRAILSWATRSTTPTAPAMPGPSWGCADSSCTPTASPSSTRRPASPWPSPTTCRRICRRRLTR